MVRIIVLAVVLALMGTGTVGAQEAPDHGGVAGSWVGALNAGGQEIRLVFHVGRDADGTLSGTMDSPDQGAFGLALSAVEVTEAGDVRFEFSAAGGEYVGRMSPDGGSIEGHWSQGGARFPLPLERTDAEAVAPIRPQEPQAPFPYEAEDVVFENGDAGIRLAGTLTIPAGEGPHPAVVLLSGSGAQDRDEAVFGHRPFLVLADYLTRRGIAVLRADDRGVGKSEGNIAIATMEDFVTDALAAVAFLKSRPEVALDAIGLVGHSEGASVAPMAANRSDDVAFLVLLAGMGMNGRDLLELQLLAINRASGVPEGMTQQRSAMQKQILDIAATAPDDSTLADQARAVLAEAGLTGQPAEAQVRALLTPWMKFFLPYDPLPALREVEVPVLMLNGEKDTQVPPGENLPPAYEALLEGGNPDVTARVLPGLNHLFQTAETGSPTEYASIEETFSPVALELIGDWILERMGRD